MFYFTPVYRIFPLASQAEIDFERDCAELRAFTNIDHDTAASILLSVPADDLKFWIAIGYTIMQSIVLIDCNVPKYSTAHGYADPIRRDWDMHLKDNLHYL